MVRTLDQLPILGWTRDTNTIPGSGLALALRTGGLELVARECLNMQAVPMVLVSGSHSTGRTLMHIQFELPQSVESSGQAALLMTDQLNKYVCK